MNRWAEPTPAWDRMINGSPTRSSYFWMAAIFSFLAIFGIGRVSTLLHGGMAALWFPTLAGFLLILIVAAAGAIRALRSARSNRDQPLSQHAFEKFRVYTVCAALISIATSMLLSFLL